MRGAQVIARQVSSMIQVNEQRGSMEIQQFSERLDKSIGQFDLLRHPFYQAWSRGELTRVDVAEYARDYYHQVQSFPRALSRFARRLGRGELRAVVLANLHEELGPRPCDSHAALWLNFAEGIGAVPAIRDTASPGVNALVKFFSNIGDEGTPEEALGAFYAYESQVPPIAREKVRGLRQFYAADDRTCQYFLVHITADVHHAQVWRTQLERRIEAYPELASSALVAATDAAQALWKALDVIEDERISRKRASSNC